MLKLHDPPPDFVDEYLSHDDDPPSPPEDKGDGGDDWWNDPHSTMFLDRFLYYGSWFILSYNGFFATVGTAMWVFAS